MAAISCDICGGGLSMDPSGDFANCDSCGMKHTKDRLKTKAQEITGTVEVSNMASLESLMKRGHLALEDGQATGYFDKVLDINPEYAPAYVGKLCANLSKYKYKWVKNDFFAYVFKKETDLARYYKPLDDMPDYQKAIRFADETYRAQLEGYNSEIKKRIAELEKKYSFYMIINSAHYDYEESETRVDCDNLVGNLKDELEVKILRTGKTYWLKKTRYSSNKFVYTKNDSIEEGDVAAISIEEERQKAEQDRIEQERRVAQEKKDMEERERREAEEERERKRIEEKEEQSRRWLRQGLCECCGGSIGGIFSRKCKVCGWVV